MLRKGEKVEVGREMGGGEREKWTNRERHDTERGGNRQRLCERELERHREGETETVRERTRVTERERGKQTQTVRERTRETQRGGNRQRLYERELERQREGETDRDCAREN